MRLFTTILFVIIVAFGVLMVNLFGVPVLTDASNGIQHYGYQEDSVVQDYVDYARKISGGDLDFVSTLDAENGLRDPFRQSSVPNALGPNGREPSYGFCQILRWSSSVVGNEKVSHNDILNDDRFWNDWKRQMDWCWSLYSERYRRDIQPKVGRGATMYGYNVRDKSKFEVEYQGGFVAGDKYKEAVETQKKLDETRVKTKQLIAQEVKLEEEARVKWKDCIDSGMCEE